MAYYLKTKKIDEQTGSKKIALLNEKEAWHLGIRPGDHLKITVKSRTFFASANVSKRRVSAGFIGLYKEIWSGANVPNGSIAKITLQQRSRSIQAIKKRLLGHRLSYEEIYRIIYDITTDRIGRTAITYFVASAYMRDYTNDELYYLTRAMADTGETIKFSGIVADKHSVGGLAGNRTTPIIIPIIASLGIKIPKTSSRAITSPAGTADTVEVLMPVTFTVQEIKKLVSKIGACLVWGGGLNVAPADDKIVQVSYPLSLEPYSKMIVSIMAKKVAMGVTHLIIDMPVGPTTKIPTMAKAKMLEQKFIFLARKFGIKLKVIMTKELDPEGFGVGPALEARDILRVLQQKNERPGDLEKKSVHLAGELLELIKYCKKGQGAKIAWAQLDSGKAWHKMREIISRQGGDAQIDSETITLGAYKKYYTAPHSGTISAIDNGAINSICRILGAPSTKLAGIYLNKEYGVRVKNGERLYTLYAETTERLRLASKATKSIKIFTIR